MYLNFWFNLDVCTVCPANFSSLNRVNNPALFCPCMTGYFEMSGQTVCQTCDYSCNSCFGPAKN